METNLLGADDPLPTLETIFIELDDADQEIALASEQSVHLLAGFVRLVDCILYFKM